MKIPADAKQRYENLFSDQDTDGDDYLIGDEVRKIWFKSGLDVQALGKVWNLVDREQTGYLAKSDFVLGKLR